MRRTSEGGKSHGPARTSAPSYTRETETCPAVLIKRWADLVLICAFMIFLFAAGLGFAEEVLTIINSDRLEHFPETKKYEATGSVEIKQENTKIRADKITYYESTSDVVAEGNVRYEDDDVSIKAKRAELNTHTKTGRLFDAEIFYKKDSYHISGKEIEKRGEHYYFSPEAFITTCDVPFPDWCFKGKNIDAIAGEELKARNVSFRIKGVPVLYAPYLRVPMIADRQTGFLLPKVGYSRSRGVSVNIPFYWAISDSSDASFILDFYSERGTGTGLEYRFVRPGGIESRWWAYHIRDTKLEKDFWEFNGLYENRTGERAGGFLNINYVNEKDFYREYSPHVDIRTQRFLESTGQISIPLQSSRLYLLSQYWVDLKNETDDVPQKIPEFGYVLNYRNAGSFLFASSLEASNILREDGISALRFDIYPRLLYSTGRDYVISQTAALRGTLYSFNHNNDIVDDSLTRLAFEYELAGHTRLFKKYASFTHVVEPSVKYHYIYSSENNLPVFDSAEIFGKTSRIEAGLLNRIIVNGEETVTVSLVQPFDADEGDRPFLPLEIGLGIKRPLNLKVDAAVNVQTGKVEAVNSELAFRVPKAGIAVGQRYNREDDIQFYTTRVEFSPNRSLSMTGRLWYDAEGGGARDITLGLTYLKKCWGVQLVYTRKPDDYTFEVRFELTGLFSNISRI